MHLSWPRRAKDFPFMWNFDGLLKITVKILDSDLKTGQYLIDTAFLLLFINLCIFAVSNNMLINMVNNEDQKFN